MADVWLGLALVQHSAAATESATEVGELGFLLTNTLPADADGGDARGTEKAGENDGGQ